MRQRRKSPPTPVHRDLKSYTLRRTLTVITSRGKVLLYSWMTSISFHFAILLLIVITHFVIAEPYQSAETTNQAVSAVLGAVDVAGDLPAFELPGENGDVLEIPAGGGTDSIFQMHEVLTQSFGTGTSGDLVGAMPGLRDGVGSGSGGSGDGVLLKVPKSGLAVTRGSFTAFTIPAQPKPRESYSIVIELKLPSDVSKYRVSDLTGDVNGTDNYTQKLPIDQRVPKASGYPTRDGQIKTLERDTVLHAVDGRIQIVVKVPGADRLVKDEINIQSRKLRETQKLTIVFGESSAPQAD